ncbi:class I SAM-dependent methyltransferase [Streptomyces albipurpureus]|uniref:Class I SAM-dependent methyltransferase n=1 Tax=Streptomyces albipurpureus TaxID=2897419 RepID=A0ABT0UM61_9ACTN|nr:class I SAM-dependent methyltransferase [Streptomyces sp. CWNU-1]MCM2389698.1 class I SAM-dependent methyltransferase [Streptomyces sp. CWNU-1]
MPQNFTVQGNDLWDPTTFDSLRRQLIPSFDLLYDSAVQTVAMSVGERPRVLDLGAGTGLLSARLLEKLPDAELTLMDRSELMLSQARGRFAAQQRVQVLVGDLVDPLPEGRFDAVVSGLAIHHLPHEEKQRLFGRIRASLNPGGVFVHVEQLLGSQPWLEKMYDRMHEAHVVRSGTPEAEWDAGRERMKFDIPIDLGTQLGWLRAAGFAEVDCLAKDWRFATYAGWVTP